MNTPRCVPPAVAAYVSELVPALWRVRPDLVGLYLHGSAALGGFRDATSDVDVLAVVDGSTPAPVQRATGEAIAAVAGCPGAGLEMSVITRATAAVLGRCPFEVHVNTTHPRTVMVTGAGHPGDPDLVLHCAVCRHGAVAVSGPPARTVFGPVPRRRVLGAMLAELRWALEHSSTAYAVLNACRAARFAEDEVLCSKLDGGEWYLRHRGYSRVVEAALDAQRGGSLVPSPDEAAGLVHDVCERLRSARGLPR